MTQTAKDLEKLKESDVINLLLYCIYKLTEDPKYSTISELIYVLDKESLYRLCASYGGCEIKIPTINDLKLITNVLMLYQMVDIQNISFTDACSKLGIESSAKKDLLDLYYKLKETIDEYEA